VQSLRRVGMSPRLGGIGGRLKEKAREHTFITRGVSYEP
jgi:hypothetical protein